MSRSRTTAAAPSPGNDRGGASIEDLERRIAALEEENQILQQIAEYRSLIISRVSHELRTPLTSILGFAEIMLSQERLTPQQQNFCKRIQNSGQQLQITLNQLSDISHLDSAKFELQLEEFALEDLLTEVANSSTTHTKKQGIHLEVTTANELPLIISDRNRLRQTLRMLLDHVFARMSTGKHINMIARSSERGCVISIETEIGADPEPLAGSSGRSHLVRAVAQYSLNPLGATLLMSDNESSFEVVIELPHHP